jgi:outer membrane receptor protein involved in Fe transport
MKKFYKVFSGLFLLILFFASMAFAGNGKVAGVVKDNNGKPVPGATVMVSGTRLGGSADLDGRYFILNIPPGKYDITVSAIGYGKKTIKSIDVKSDFTTDLNVSLQESAVEIDGVVVEAQRKLVDKTLTATRTTISSDELSNALPISSTYEILQTAPSVFRGFIRGGKQEQTKTLVEGVDISDEYYYQAATQTVMGTDVAYNAINRYSESRQSLSANVNPNSISELTVNTGAVGADYTSAVAGIVSYSLKEGKGALGGRAYFRTSGGKLTYRGPDVYGDKDKYYAERDTAWATYYRKKDTSQMRRAQLLNWYDGKYGTGKQSFEGDVSLNGSITDDLGFFLSSNIKDNPESRLPNTKYREMNTQLKFNYNLTSNIKLTAFGIINDRGKLLKWANSDYSEYWRFFLEGNTRWNRLGLIGSLKMTHFLTNNTFYEIQINNKYDHYTRGFIDANNDGKCDVDGYGDFITFGDSASIKKYVGNNDDTTKFFGLSPGGVDQNINTKLKGQNNMTFGLKKPGVYYDDFKYNIITGKIDFTSQITYNHQLKAGLNYEYSDYDKDRRSASGNGADYRLFEEEAWKVQPVKAGAYLMDRMEYAGLVIKASARLDMWDPKASDYSNYFKPFAIDTVGYEDGAFVTKIPVRGKKIDPYYFFSPQIGVSHPISDKATIYFSFSKMAQPPPASNLYTNYNYFGPSRPTVLSLSRDPYYTTNYEIGGQWEVVPNISININAYQKDIQNYNNASFTITPRPGVLPTSFEYYYVSFSTGYANSRGVEFELVTLPFNIYDVCNLSGRVSYTYSYVKGPLFVPGVGQSTAFVAASGDSAKYGSIPPFSDYKYYNKVEINYGGSTSSLTGGFDREHRISYTLFARFPYDISLTSLGTFQSGFYWRMKFVDDRVADRALTTGPWNANVDLRIEKAFKFGQKTRVAVFADIKNLLNRSNIIAYDNSAATGAELWEKTGDPTGTAHRAVGTDGSLYYDNPREIYFGVTIDF